MSYGVVEIMSNGKNTIRVNFDLDKELHKELRIKATREETSIKEVLTNAVKEYVKE